MAKIYALSDIHGYIDLLQEKMKKVDLSGNNKLIFLGDYIDRGPSSKETLEYVLDLQKQYPNQVIALKGNHEEMFLEWIDGLSDISYLQTDHDLQTIRTFLTEEQLADVDKKCNSSKQYDINRIVIQYVQQNNRALIEWIKGLPVYHETENQIFVHAGIDEEAGEYWNYAIDAHYCMSKFPPTTGYFHKDIIAGHTGTSFFVSDKDFHGIYFDGKSHYYIDSTVYVSHKLNLLIYDTETKKYTFR